MGVYDTTGHGFRSKVQLGSLLRRSGSPVCGIVLLLTTAVASGQEAPEAREIAPGEWRSQRDNPWQVLPDFSVSLSAIEQAERTARPVSVSDPPSASATWNFEMELWTTVSGTDPFSSDFAPTGERAHTFISVPGVYTGGMVVPFKTEGLFLGHEPTNLRWRKSFAVSSTVADVLWLPDEENWALEEDVEIRAVSIIEAYPEGGAPKLGFARALQLMDGLPPRNVSRQSNGGVIEFLGFQVKDPPELFEFGQRPLRLIRAEGGGTYVAPDDVFSQCGVQFRLASYVAVKVPSDVYEGAVRRLPLDVVMDPSVCTMLPGRPNADDKGDCILGVVDWENNFPGQRTLCGGDTERALDARRDAIELVKEYAKAVPRDNLLTGMTGETGVFEGINVVLMGQIGGGLLTDRCKDPNALFGDVDLGLTDPNSWVAVSTDLAGAQPTTLSHELGHQLLGGYDHVDYTTNLATDLMKEGDGDGFHIPGCQTWQHAFPGLPVGCDPNAVASVEARNLCEEMRDVVPPPPPPAPARMEPGDPLDFLSRRWTYGRFSWGGATEAVFSDAQATEGSYAITVPVGYRDIASPSFRTADLPEVGDHLSVDVFIPSPVTNPYWVGAVALFVDIPSAGIYNQWISQRDLTPLSRGAWSTLEFRAPRRPSALHGRRGPARGGACRGQLAARHLAASNGRVRSPR